ncbi:thioredoxin family protein [Robertkochia flava]|uniref:thioredoxin family protein n=1 Tax=Robertkochia flava TaxID=3447986 RepID=UPI001CC91F0D|nr:thioredoxin family protein [Robertkochia marina]
MKVSDSISCLLFSGTHCGICQAIKPKLQAMTAQYPEVEFHIKDSAEQPELAARHSVFSIPTLLIFAEGKEYRRYHGAFSIQTVEDDLGRLISLMH